MSHDTAAYLADALDSARKVQGRIDDVTFEQFRADEVLQDAVIHRLMIIGEALNNAHRQQPDLDEAITDLRKIIGNRHVITHGYFQLKLEIVYRIAVAHVGLLITELERLPELSPAPGDDEPL